MKKKTFKITSIIIILSMLMTNVALAVPIHASMTDFSLSSNNILEQNDQPEETVEQSEPEIERALTYHEVEDPVPVLTASEEAVFAQRGALPSKFSAVDTGQVTSLKDQGIYGTCWAFAAIGASEASLISQGIVGTEVDLSERQLAYYFYQKGTTGDLLGGTTGDYNTPLTSTYMNQGGNSLFTMWHLASWAGIVDETQAPYEELGTALPVTSENVYGSDTYHLQNAYIVNKENTDTIKQMIMEYGSMAIAYYSSNSSSYDNPENDCYYYNGPATTNHAVQVVGWDDTFSKDNFTITPEGDGAWLIKNSWGEENSMRAQYGYFWISYYDTSISDNFFAYICESADNYDNIYQYDGAAGNMYVNTDWAANVYTATANDGGIEKIEAVGIGNYSNGVNYTVEIYTDLTSKMNPTSGTKVASQEGTLTYSGYHTIPLDEPVYIGEGEQFSVVFSFETKTAIYVDYSYQNSSWIKFTTNELDCTSYYKQNEYGLPWSDAKESADSTFRIKAYTSNALPSENGQLQSIALDKTSLTLDMGSSAQLQVSYKPYYTTDDKTIQWTSSDVSVAAVDQNGKVTGVSPGTATITAACGSKTATCIVTVKDAKVLVQSINNDAGTFTVKAAGLNEISDVVKVQFAVWSEENGQDDLVWYTANNAGGGVYTKSISIQNHGSKAGKYIIHAYVVDSAGVMSLWGATNCIFTQTSMSMQAISAQVSADEESVTITATNVSGVESLWFAVWSSINGQDDLIWYSAQNNGNGVWSVIVPLSKHQYAAGSYQIHAYGQNVYYANQFLKNTTFQISGPQLDNVSVKNVNNGAGTFIVEAKGVNAKAGINKVEAAVWSKSDQSNLKWYTATKQSNGTYMVPVNIADHDYQYGIYTVHVYVTDNNGVQILKGATAEIAQPVAVLEAAGNGNQTQFNIKALNVGYAGGVKNVRAAVWSINGGQDDLVWYSLADNGNGIWSTNVLISNHKTAGIYQVHMYIEDKNGGLHLGGSTTFEIEAPTVDEILITNIENESGKFSVEVNGISAKAGIAKVDIAVWSKRDQSDLRWYTAMRQNDGTYLVPVSIANHCYQYGTYTAHAYIIDNNGISTVAGATAAVTQPIAVLTATENGNQTQYNIKASNIGYTDGIKSAMVAVWSTNGGQDDLIWYSMLNNGNGIWSTNIPIVNHRTAGTYCAHMYIEDKNGELHLIGNTTFNVEGPVIGEIVIENVDSKTGTFTIDIDEVSAKAGISKVEVAVWSKSDQSNLRWYAAVQNDEIYTVPVNITNHGCEYGNYIIHVYAEDNNGIQTIKGGSAGVAQPLAVISAIGNENYSQFNLKAFGVEYAGGVKNVRAAVWSAANGQDDLIWYMMVNGGNGVWSVDIPVSNHKTGGTYYAHMYIDDANGNARLIGNTTFNVEYP